MRIKILGLAIASTILIAGCGASPLGKFLGKADAPTLSAAERNLVRFGVLNTTEICDTCWVTGGGAGNDIACDGAKFGLNAHDTDGLTGTDGKGRLNFTFEKDFHINGPVEFVRCLSITEGLNGDTWGDVEFGGTVQVEKDLGNSTYTFLVTVHDEGEPNVADTLNIKIFDANGLEVFDWSCETEDGNIQLHATRFAQVE